MLLFRKFPVSIKFIDRGRGGGRGSFKIIRRNFFVSPCGKKLEGNHSGFH